jgi:hypothetical protein
VFYLQEGGGKDYGTMLLFGLHASDINFYEIGDLRSKASG